MTKNVLAIGAHPDDIEFMMAGTVLMLARAGYVPSVFVVASGSCGSATTDRKETARIRLEEARRAAQTMDAHFFEPVVDDLEVLYALPLLRKIAAVVRQAEPDIILTHSPEEYMEDHSQTCRLAVTAAFSRGMRNFACDPDTAPVTKSLRLYHGLPYGLQDGLGRSVAPDLLVDIAPVLDRKREALACHRSQKEWLDTSQGLDSYLNTMESMSQKVGRWSGRFEAAEGWRRHGWLGFCAEDYDPLSVALGESICEPER